MRRKLLVVLALICVATFLGVQYWALQQKETQVRLASLIRDTPDHIFYPVFIGVIALSVGPIIWIMINQRRWSRLASSGSVLNAKKVASSLWHVDGEPMVKGGWAVMRFRHLSFGRQSFILPVRPGHPDIKLFQQLKHDDVVEFEQLSEGMDCALDHELCGFLRIKSVS